MAMKLAFLAAVLAAGALVWVGVDPNDFSLGTKSERPDRSGAASSAPPIGALKTGWVYTDEKGLRVFLDDFERSYVVEEAARPDKRASLNWWVSSGGYFFSEGGIARGVIGELELSNPWRRRYEQSNPKDTDGGIHPQNIFRLVERGFWGDYEQSVYAKVLRINESESKNRNFTNGLYLFNRYKDENNLYYTGLRVDGFAEIKKKIDGEYYTLVETPAFPNMPPRGRGARPNQIPLEKWVGIRSVVKTIDDGVSISFYLDLNQTGEWQLAARAVDQGVGGPPFISAGHAGLRTDFMDVEFNDYLLREIR